MQGAIRSLIVPASRSAVFFLPSCGPELWRVGVLNGVSCAGRDDGGVFSSLGAGEDDLGVAVALEGSEPVGVRDGEEPILLSIARRFWRIFPRELASIAKAVRRVGAVIPYLFGRRQGRL